MAYGEVGGGSVVIPDLNATGNMTVEFSRNVKSFALNRYSELRPVTKTRGLYLRIDPAQGMRSLYGDGREFRWAGGSMRPTGINNRQQWEFENYNTLRDSYTAPLDERDIGQALWDVKGSQLRALGQQAMTVRTQRALTVLNNASWGSNAAVVDGGSIPGIGGGQNWSNGTATAPYLQIALQFAQNQIMLATGGLVRPEDLVLVFSPATAIPMSQAPEIKQFMGNSVWAYGQITGNLPGTETRKNWGLPPTLYDTPVMIEDCVAVTTAKGASTQTNSYALAKSTAYLLARGENGFIAPELLAAERGEIKLTDEQRENVPVYSTLAGFFKEEFTIESRSDTWHRIFEMGVTQDMDYQLSSALSGFKFTKCVG